MRSCVQGPGDVLAFTPDGMKAGALDEDLKTACMKALRLNRDDARAYAMNFAWEACAKQFIVNLALEEMPVEETVEERAAIEVVG